MTEGGKQYYVGTVPGPRMEGGAFSSINDATMSFARAFSALDPEPIIAMMADDVVYEGQHVREPIVGLDEVSKYLRARYTFIRERIERTKGHLTLAMGEVGLPEAENYPCAIGINADDEPEMLFVISLDKGGRIDRLDLLSVAPRPEEARRTGVVYTGDRGWQGE